MVMTANAMGKDLYLNIPEMASGSDPSDTTSYIYQLANLIKNGSTDSNSQYYPPLNPNLKVYVEYTRQYWQSPPRARIDASVVHGPGCKVAGRTGIRAGPLPFSRNSRLSLGSRLLHTPAAT
jgi:hypothetical protein